jgi:polyisoprenoid-binding protein YceI
VFVCVFSPLLHAVSLSADSGAASFAVDTNAIGIRVTGKSDALRVNVDLHNAANILVIDHVAAWVPSKTLVTGMSLRDDHMRKYVFDKPNGESPDLRFEAEGVSCAAVTASQNGRESSCPVTGTLSIRGIPRPFKAVLKVRQESLFVFRIRGEGSMKLSDYGIEQPSQLGVHTANDIQIHLEFTARPTTSAALSGNAAR